MPNGNSINSWHDILVDKVISSQLIGRQELLIKSYSGISLFCVIYNLWANNKIQKVLPYEHDFLNMIY